MKAFQTVGALALILAATAASAQTPQRTTATYGDWTLRCETTGENARACEMGQSITVQGQSRPIAQIAIGPMADGGYRLVAQLPLAVWLPGGVTLTAGDENVPAEYKRCFPQFCLADAVISDAMLAHLRGQSEAGAVTFQDAAQRAVKVPLSFNGLDDAFKALTAE